MISNLVDDEIVLIKVEEMNYLSEQKKSQEQKKKKNFFFSKTRNVFGFFFQEMSNYKSEYICHVPATY